MINTVLYLSVYNQAAGLKSNDRVSLYNPLVAASVAEHYQDIAAFHKIASLIYHRLAKPSQFLAFSSLIPYESLKEIKIIILNILHVINFLVFKIDSKLFEFIFHEFFDLLALLLIMIISELSTTKLVV